MSSPAQFRSRGIHSTASMACAVVGLAVASTPAAWSASGTVKNATGSNLSGVAVTVKDSSSQLKTTTDGNGNFTIGSATGILSSGLPGDFSVRQEGGEIVVQYPARTGLVQMSLVDISGATLWRSQALLDQGVAHVPFSAGTYHGAAILRVRHGDASLSQPVTMNGSAGFNVVPRPVAARSLAANPTLLFSKPGSVYHDTSFTLNSTSQTGINVVMRDTTPPVSTTCQVPPSPNAGSGSFTNYWFGQGSYQENGHYALACGYHGFETGGQSSDKVNNIANPQYFVAIPGNKPSDFTNVLMCGACVELTGQNGTKVVATVADECPEYNDNGSVSNQPCINNFKGHLDIGYPAFSKLGFSVGNPSGTSWKFVICPVTGNVVVRVKPGNTDQLYVENTILPIKDVAINGASSTRLSYGAWQLSRRAAGATVVIKDYSDRTITYTIPASLGTDVDQDIGMQFPACK